MVLLVHVLVCIPVRCIIVHILGWTDTSIGLVMCTTKIAYILKILF